MKSARMYAFGLTLSALAAILPSCGGDEKKEITRDNYIVRELMLPEVDSFLIKQSNRPKEERKKDTLETVVKIRGYAKGVNPQDNGLIFLLEDGSGYGKFCKFEGQSSINALLEAVLDMGKVTAKPDKVTVYGAIDDDTKFLQIKRVEYDGKVFDWSKKVDAGEMFKDVAYSLSAQEMTLDSLLNKTDIQQKANVKLSGYVLGRSSGNQFAFVLGDENGNSILCYKQCVDYSSGGTYPGTSEMKTLVDAMNQTPVQIQVTGNFTKAYGGLLMLESLTTPNTLGRETKTLSFDTGLPQNKDSVIYIPVTAREAKELENYRTVKIVGDVAGVTTDPITLALIKDFNGETVFCRKAEGGEYTEIGNVMLKYTKEMQGKKELIDGKIMYKYIEISGRLADGVINIEEMKDVWSENPITSKEDMNKVLYRPKLDHRVNFND